MARDAFLLYGANGYTGKLVLEAALRRNVLVALAGRRREAVEPLAKARGLPFHVLPLDDPGALKDTLGQYGALLLAAGPFSQTSAPALAACLAARVPYLDITGEVDVFEAVFARDDEARAAGVPLLPGVGFDVVPSDCLAGSLAAALPGANRLLLAFRGFKTSPGTTKTMIEGFSKGGVARVDGELRPVPAAWKTRTVRFSDREREVVSIPWGDLSTAWRSTGIPSIETYMAMPPAQISALSWLRPLLGVTSWSPVQWGLKALAEWNVSGPTEEERERERSFLWGRVERADGAAVEGTLETLEGYSLTAETAVAAVARVLAGEVRPGATTPALAFGPRFIESFPGTRLVVPARG